MTEAKEVAMKLSELYKDMFENIACGNTPEQYWEIHVDAMQGVLDAIRDNAPTKTDSTESLAEKLASINVSLRWMEILTRVVKKL